MRPLIVRCGALGDMVLLTALIRPLHARFRQPVDIVTSGPWSEPLLRGQPGVGEIMTLGSRRTPYWLSFGQQRVVRRLRERGLTATYFCDGNDAALPILIRAGIPEALIVRAKNHDLRPGEHATEQWRRLSQILPSGLPPCEPWASPPELRSIAPGCHLQIDELQRADLDAWRRARGLSGRPLLALQIGNKRTMRRGPRRLAVNSKYWPMERWADVLRFLRQRHPSHAIVLLGTGPEYQLNQQLAELAGIGDLHNAADDLAIPRLVALLERADGLITVDSGPAHAAAAVGCPQVVLFGKALPSLYRPWGSASPDVKILQGHIDGELDMRGIEVDSVTAAWSELRLRARQAPAQTG